MTILITGGAGYVGSILIDYLFNADIKIKKIIAVDNLMYKQTSLTQYSHLKEFEFYPLKPLK